ncbi:hypothetical protein EEB14_51065 [Rhodococcus sp. WS4]|nr:hypothetical protein EEB14_51065 [Rhodococcus sp. WS4]
MTLEHGVDNRDAVRALIETREAFLVRRTRSINELESLIVVAPERPRHSAGLSLTKRLAGIEAVGAVESANHEHRVTVLTVQSFTAQIRFLCMHFSRIRS